MSEYRYIWRLRQLLVVQILIIKMSYNLSDAVNWECDILSFNCKTDMKYRVVIFTLLIYGECLFLMHALESTP